MDKENLLQFTDSGVPHSLTFNDFYFPNELGLKASEYIFIHGSMLSSQLSNREKWRVSELGFGTGLNFFALLHFWNQHAKMNQQLTYMSIEGFPLPAERIQSALNIFPELHRYINEFAHQAIALTNGTHKFEFLNGRVHLYLIIGEVEDSLDRINVQQNCWFLDGFAPSRNPRMWSESVCNKIARLSSSEALLSTWCSAGEVRRKLSAAGFHIEKFKGFQSKRESIRGVFRRHSSGKSSTVKNIAIVGSGIAGAHIAHEARSRGLDVTLIERSVLPPISASTNQAGLTYPYIGGTPEILSTLYTNSFLHNTRKMKLLDAQGKSHITVSSLQTLATPRLRRIFANKHNFSEQMRNLVNTVHNDTFSGFHLPMSQRISPSQLISTLTQNVTIKQATVSKVQTNADSCVVEIIDQNGREEFYEYDFVVLCCSWHLHKLVPELGRHLEPVRGEVFYLSSKTPLLNEIALCFSGYALPLNRYSLLLGSSYDHFKLQTSARTSDLHHLLKQAADAYPNKLPTKLELSGSRVSFRSSTSDRLPIVGKIRPNLFVCTALGSRGLTSAAMLAHDLIATMINDQTLLSTNELMTLNPDRFTKAHLNDSALNFYCNRNS